MSTTTLTFTSYYANTVNSVYQYNEFPDYLVFHLSVMGLVPSITHKRDITGSLLFVLYICILYICVYYFSLTILEQVCAFQETFTEFISGVTRVNMFLLESCLNHTGLIASHSLKQFMISHF